jgi:hypothetical protein
MKKGFLGALALLLLGGVASATMTSDQIFMLNNQFGAVPRQVQLGSLLSTIETNASSSQALASGKVFVGNSSNAPVARTLSGDVTVDNTGVTAIGAGKVLESMVQVPTTSGLGLQRIARFKFDPSANSGQRAVQAHDLGVTLPANAIITRSFFKVLTAFTSVNSSALVALHCETASNIFSQQYVSSLSTTLVTEGVSSGTSSLMKPITSACAITATVTGTALTAGKLVGWVTYVVAE